MYDQDVSDQENPALNRMASMAQSIRSKKTAVTVMDHVRMPPLSSSERSPEDESAEGAWTSRAFSLRSHRKKEIPPTTVGARRKDASTLSCREGECVAAPWTGASGQM